MSRQLSGYGPYHLVITTQKLALGAGQAFDLPEFVDIDVSAYRKVGVFVVADASHAFRVATKFGMIGRNSDVQDSVNTNDAGQGTNCVRLLVEFAAPHMKTLYVLNNSAAAHDYYICARFFNTP